MLAFAINKGKNKKFNQEQINQEVQKVKLTRKKILNDEELQTIIEEGGLGGDEEFQHF